MASELLKTFKKIENARQRGINILNRLDYKVNANASLSAIHEYLNFLPNDNSNLILPVDVITNPDIDPEIWREPSDWPDICKILSEAEDIDTYTPCAIALLDNTIDETKIVYNVTSSTDLSTFKYYYNTSLTSKCVTSDGVTYDLLGSNYTHVWDKTKDINGKYRYIIFYINTKNIPNGSWFYPQRLNAIAMACNQFMYAYSYSYDKPISNSYANIGGYKCQAVYLINPKTQLGIDFYNRCANTYNNTLSTIIGSNQDYRNPLKKIIIEKPMIDAINSGNRWGIASQGQLYRSLNYLEDNRNSDASRLSYNSGVSLIYYKGTFKSLVSDNTNNYDLRPRLKYVYITDADSITEISTYAFTNHYSVVTDIVTPFKNVTKINKYAYMNCGLNLNKIMQFPKVTDLAESSFYRLSAQMISLPSLKTITTAPFNDSRCCILLLESLETITTLGTIHGLIEIYAPNLKVATGEYLTRGDILYRPLTINFSSLETLTYADYFKNNVGLRNLILKQDFKFNLDLSKCKALTKSCALDLINKCAQLEESESYTLTFHNILYYSLTEEELAIATNKGWTVIYKS